MKATAVVSFSTKQRPRTHWKLICHSGAVVKWNGCRGISQFFSNPWQFVASGKDSTKRREYLTAALFSLENKTRNLCVSSDKEWLIYSARQRAGRCQTNEWGKKVRHTNKRFSTCISQLIIWRKGLHARRHHFHFANKQTVFWLFGFANLELIAWFINPTVVAKTCTTRLSSDLNTDQSIQIVRNPAL